MVFYGGCWRTYEGVQRERERKREWRRHQLGWHDEGGMATDDELRRFGDVWRERLLDG